MEIVLFDKMSDKFHFIPCTEETLRHDLCKYLQENKDALDFRDNKAFEALLNNITSALDFEGIQQLMLDVDMASGTH